MEILNEEQNQTCHTRPEPGQLAEVRRRQWSFTEVVSSKPTLMSGQQNAVTLSSIDEDGLGEELKVIWEIEPGAQVIERVGFPSITGQDDSDTLEAFLGAVRWGAVTNADRGFLQAPFCSGISIEDFQLGLLVRPMEMTRVNLLIDDVGLSKTIKAGLIIQELLLRHQAHRIDRLPRIAVRKLVRGDAGKVRTRIPRCRHGIHQATAPRTRHSCQPLDISSTPDHLHELGQGWRGTSCHV